MRVLLLTIAMLSLFACQAPRWPVKPAPGDPGLTISETFQIIRDGGIKGREGIGNESWWYYSWDERLGFMDAPVIVVSVNPISHGVFRDKYRGYALVVKDKNGNIFSLGETAMADVKTGDRLK